MLTFIFPLISGIIIFSKAHGMSYFHTRVLDCNKYLLHEVFQRVRTKPHLSSLKNVENSTSNSRQFFQIC